MDIISRIETLDKARKDIVRKIEAYNKGFEATLKDFIKERGLDKTVARNETGKEEIGELRIVDGTKRGYKNNPAIPYYIVFHPYRRDGVLSQAHRIDDIVVNEPSDYFDGIIKRYKPAERGQ